VGEPPVQQYLWSAKTKLNANVPIRIGNGPRSTSNQTSCATLNESKRREWQQAAAYSMYSTTSETAAAAAVLPVEQAASQACCGADRRASAEGQRASVGKSGPFCADLNKNYHVLKLRK
jgi:hypothetical protein